MTLKRSEVSPGVLGRWRENRQRRRDCEVLGALVGHPAGSRALEIATRCGRPPGSLYPTLARLESQRRIVSWWAPGSYPRRRLYSLAPRDGAS